MIIWTGCFAQKLSFSHEKLYYKFHYFKLFISAESTETQKLTDVRKLSTLIQTEPRKP